MPSLSRRRSPSEARTVREDDLTEALRNRNRFDKQGTFPRTQDTLALLDAFNNEPDRQDQNQNGFSLSDGLNIAKQFQGGGAAGGLTADSALAGSSFATPVAGPASGTFIGAGSGASTALTADAALAGSSFATPAAGGASGTFIGAGGAGAGSGAGAAGGGGLFGGLFGGGSGAAGGGGAAAGLGAAALPLALFAIPLIFGLTESAKQGRKNAAFRKKLGPEEVERRNAAAREKQRLADIEVR